MVLFQLIGLAVCVFLVIYAPLFIGYKILGTEAESCIDREKMP